MAIPTKKKTKFVSIVYPGIVENVDNMLETLGGETNISNTYADPNCRLELRWRPTDVFCKPACSDRKRNIKQIVLKVKKKKKKLGESSGDSPTPDSLFHVEILGLVDCEFTFTSMMDFQYLPVRHIGNDKYESIRNEIMIDQIQPSSWLDEGGGTSMFLLPTIFSRMDKPQEYMYRESPMPRGHPDKVRESAKSDFIGVDRTRRAHHTQVMSFDDDNVPTEPKPEAVARFNTKQIAQSQLEKLRECFRTRPIWSRSALVHHVGLHVNRIKVMLPIVSYYFVTGPWSRLWVRMGYDPRKDKAAKMYQAIDFRIRQRSVRENLQIASKRGAFKSNSPLQSVKFQKSTFSLQKGALAKNIPTQERDRLLESAYKFRPGMMPACRQTSYQLCDIEESEIQKLVHSNDNMETGCTHDSGWCIPDIQDKCREIITKHIEGLIVVKGFTRDMHSNQYHNKTVPGPIPSTSTQSDQEQASSSIGIGNLEENMTTEILKAMGSEDVEEEDESEDDYDEFPDDAVDDEEEEYTEMGTS